mmetsp:Transcript_8955/g.26666  ORF Transcript_8955/g.26666 Transcript_8955/m.26666 type:complete len:317 (-) Transcript_8955:108-1058(-)
MRGPNIRQVTVDASVPNLFDDDSDDDSGWTQEDPEVFWAGRKNRLYPSKRDARPGGNSKSNNNNYNNNYNNTFADFSNYTNYFNINNDNYDDDDASGSGSQGSYARVDPTGTVQASPVSAIGLFSLFQNQSFHQPEKNRPSSADTIVQDLTRSELELDRMEADMWGFEAQQYEGEQQREQQQREHQQQREQQQRQQQKEKEKQQQPVQHLQLRIVPDEDKSSTLTDSISAGQTVPSTGETSGDSPEISKSKKRGSVLLWMLGIFLFLAMCALFAIGGYLLYQNHFYNNAANANATIAGNTTDSGDAIQVIEAIDGV